MTTTTYQAGKQSGMNGRMNIRHQPREYTLSCIGDGACEPLGACEAAPEVDAMNAEDDAPVIHDLPLPPSPQIEPDDGETLAGLVAKAEIAFFGEIVDID